MTAGYRLKGVNDAEDTCAQCGRRNLKRVAWLEHLGVDGNADTEPAPYGLDCAGMLLYGHKTAGHTAIVRKRGAAMELARRWLAAGHPAETVARGVWNRFGFQTEVTPDGIRFAFGMVTA